MNTNNICLNSMTMLPLTKIVSAHIAKSLWNASFTLRNQIGVDINQIGVQKLDWSRRLRNHCERIARISNTLIEENGLPIIFKDILKESIFSLRQVYFQVEMWKTTYTYDLGFSLLPDSESIIQNYFTVYGKFNDLLFAKHIVNNPNYDFCQRFNMACLYCFENEIESLWKELKTIYPDYKSKDSLINIRICILKNRLQDLEQHPNYEGNVWEFGLKKSVVSAYEYCFYYFWNKLSEERRIEIIKSDTLFELLDCVANYGEKITFFLYSQLPNDRKQDFWDYIVYSNGIVIWTNLSHFWHIQTLRSELIECSHQLPI